MSLFSQSWAIFYIFYYIFDLTLVAVRFLVQPLYLHTFLVLTQLAAVPASLSSKAYDWSSRGQLPAINWKQSRFEHFKFHLGSQPQLPTARTGQRVYFTWTCMSRQMPWRCCSISTTSSLFSVWQKPCFKALIDIQMLSDGGKKYIESKREPAFDPDLNLQKLSHVDLRGTAEVRATRDPPRRPRPLADRHFWRLPWQKTDTQRWKRPLPHLQLGDARTLTIFFNLQMLWQCHRLIWKHLKANFL